MLLGPFFSLKQMNYKGIFILLVFCICGCSGSDKTLYTQKLTQDQSNLLNEGWVLSQPSGADLEKMMGVKPIYGTKDNYFDITVGTGYDVVAKLVEKKENKCIRCVYVKENSTTTIHDIPQGVYYLKLAFGKDWMVLDGKGMFTKSVSYEKCQDVFIYKFQGDEDVNYSIKLNVANSTNNLHTTTISENEFLY